MLPPDLTVEDNVRKAAKILAPFLIISHHLVINFDEVDLKTALMQSVQTLMKATEFYDYTFLKANEHDDMEN